MTIDPKLVQDLYNKYAPEKYSKERLAKINAKYGDDHTAFLLDFYKKYTPNEPVTLDRFNKIADRYGLKKKGVPASGAGSNTILPAPNYETRQVTPDLGQQGLEQGGFDYGQVEPDNIERNWLVGGARAAEEVYARNVPMGYLGKRATTEQGRLEFSQEQLAQIMGADDDELVTIQPYENTSHTSFSPNIKTMQAGKARSFLLDNIQQSAGKRNEAVSEAIAIARKHDPNEKRLLQSWDDVNNGWDLMNFIFTATGQSVAQIPLSVGTFGTSSFLQEFGDVYINGVMRIAEKEGITPQEVIERGLDQEHVADAAAGISAGLDYIGAKKVMGMIGGKQLQKTLQKRALQILGTQTTEGVTEGAQSVVTQVGEDIMAGDPISVEVKQVRDEGLAGFFGSGAIAAVTHRGGKEQTAAEEAAPIERAIDKTDEAVEKVGFLTGVNEAKAAPAVDEIVEEVQVTVDNDLINNIRVSRGEIDSEAAAEQEAETKKEVAKLKDEQAKLKDKKQNLKQTDKVTSNEEKRVDERLEEIKEEIVTNETEQTTEPTEQGVSDVPTIERKEVAPTEVVQPVDDVRAKESKPVVDTKRPKPTSAEDAKVEVTEEQLKEKAKAEFNERKTKDDLVSWGYNINTGETIMISRKDRLTALKKEKKELKRSIDEDDAVIGRRALDKLEFVDKEIKSLTKPKTKRQKQAARKATPTKPVKRKTTSTPSQQVPKVEDTTKEEKVAERVTPNTEIADKVFAEPKPKKEKVDKFTEKQEDKYQQEKKELLDEYKVITGTKRVNAEIERRSVPELRKLVNETKTAKKEAERLGTPAHKKLKDAEDFYKEVGNKQELATLAEARKIHYKLSKVTELDPTESKAIRKELSNLRNRAREVDVIRAVKAVEDVLNTKADKKAEVKIAKEAKIAKDDEERAMRRAEAALEKKAAPVVKERKAKISSKQKAAVKLKGARMSEDKAFELANADETVQKWQAELDKAIDTFEETTGRKVTAKERKNLSTYGTFEDPVTEFVEAMKAPKENGVTVQESVFGDESVESVAADGYDIGRTKPKRIDSGVTATTADSGYMKMFSAILNAVNGLRTKMGVPSVEVYTVDKITPITEEEQLKAQGKGVAGVHFTYKGRSIILISKSVHEGSAKTGTHEGIHAIGGILYHIAVNSGVPKMEKHVARISSIFKRLTEAAAEIGLDSNAIYGLTNEGEMVAEAFVDDNFIMLMSSIEGNKAGLSGKKNLFTELVDVLKKLFKDLFNLINNSKSDLISPINKDGFNLHDELTYTMDDLLTYAQSLTREQLKDNKLISQIKRDTKTEFSFTKEGNLPKANLSKIVESAIDKNIDSESKFITYRNKLEKALVEVGSKPFTALDKAQLTKQFNKLNGGLKEEVARLQEAAKKVSNTTIYQTNPAFRDGVDALMEIDYNELTPNKKTEYRRVLTNLTENLSLKDTGNLIADVKAKAKIEEFLKDFNPEEVRQIRKLFFNSIDPHQVLSSAQITEIMAAYDPVLAAKIERMFFADTMQGISKAQNRAHRIYSDEVVKLMKELNTDDTNAIRIHMYSLLMRMEGEAASFEVGSPEFWKEVVNNAADIKAALERKLEAAKNKDLSRYKVEAVQREIDIFNGITKDIDTKGFDALTSKEAKMRDKLREIYDRLEPEVRANAEIFYGETFPDQLNYVPDLAVGTYRKNSLVDTFHDIKDKFVKIIEGEENAFSNFLAIPESGHYKARKGGKNAIYSYSAVEIAAEYLDSTLLRIHATEAAKVMDRVLRSPKVVEAIGQRNGKVIKQTVGSWLKSAATPYHNYGRLIKAFEGLKNEYMISTIGNMTQVPLQILGTASGVMIATSPAASGKGLQALVKLGDSATAFFDNIGLAIQNRDAFIEKNEDIEMVHRQNKQSKNWFNKGYQKGAEASKLSAKPFIWSDKKAAQWTFLSVFLNEGGDINNPTSEKSKTAAMVAERKTSMIQNSSNITFAPEMFRPDSPGWRIAMSATMIFKSFAWNQAMTMFTALPHVAKKKEARKMALSAFSMYVSYHLLQETLIRPAVNLLWQGLLGTEKDEEDDDKTYGDVEKIASNIVVDMLVGWLPAPIEFLGKYTKREVVDRAIFEYIKEEGEYRNFNAIKDSPTYSGYGVMGGAAGVLSGGGPFFKVVDGTVQLGEVLISRDEGEDFEFEELLGYGIREGAIAFMAMKKLPIPLKGDVLKLGRVGLKELDEKVNGDAPSSSTAPQRGRSNNRRRSTRTRNNRR